MKRKYLIIGSLACSHFFAQAQVTKDTLQEKLTKTEIELVYNHYIQDGDNSAVTGGIGTEKLIVYGPGLTIKKTNGNNALSLNLGADIITSASNDNIDYVMSSASKTDTRYYANTTYEHNFEKHNLAVNGGIGFSLESDYFSIGSKLGFVKEDKDKLRTYSVLILVFNDDLRWGRLNPDYYRPVKLIYPVELRYKEWYDDYRRNSYNLKLGFTQVLNPRNIIGIFPEFAYQEGLLATSYHRIYFSDGTEAVEQLPKERWKGALALRLNSFLGGNVILKNTVSGYADNFGIFAFSLENETAIKLKYDLTLLPNLRFYSQTASKYFAPYGVHKSNETYYTSDYDLSKLQTYSVGIGLKFNPYKYLNKRTLFNAMILRYNFSYRSNDLTAHIFSIVFQSEFHKNTNLRL
jgi:Protein of unknown function (DUF3570)